MSSNFRVGMKVVCIETNGDTPPGVRLLTPITTPQKGKVYTIRRVQSGTLLGGTCIAVEEIPDQVAVFMLNGQKCRGDIVWMAKYFRPVVTRKTDISCFQALLTGKRVEERA